MELPYAERLTPEETERLESVAKQCQTDDQAWEYFATSVLGPGATGEPYRDKVIKVLQRVRGKVGNALCHDDKIKWFTETNEASDTLSLATVISGRLSGMLPGGVDLIALSILIARIGLRRFCNSDFTGL